MERGRTLTFGTAAPWPEEGIIVGHYLFRGTYTAVGIKGVMTEGASSRAAVIRSLVEGVGGTLECMYWSFGEHDVLAIAELPDNVAAAALATSISAGGSASVSTTVLLTADEIDAAGKVQVAYRPAGA
ncbi:MAG TPA: GYD domain-containing protein [Acidimicrobiales bacterium]